MLRKLRQTIDAHGLIRLGDHLVLAVSGGADSIGLLHGLWRLRAHYRMSLTVVHVDHRLRGGLSAADAAFVSAQAALLGLRCISERCDAAGMAERGHLSLEEAARAERYAILSRTCAALSADAIATGHTRNDQAETVLLKLLRGAGPRGLRGIHRCSERWGHRVIRPLLDCGRRDVVLFLRAEGLSWREDASNADDRFLRNRVRRELVPLLVRRFNPNIVEVLARTADVLGEEDQWLQRLAGEGLARCVDPNGDGRLRCPALKGEPVAMRRRIVRQWLLDNQVAPGVIEYSLIDRILDLADGEAGSLRIPIRGGGWVERIYEGLVIQNDVPAPAEFRVPLPVPGAARAHGWRVATTWDVGFQRGAGHGVGNLPAEGWIRRDKAETHALMLRNWRPGDVIRPLGLNGSIKLQDVWVNAKVPRGLRQRLPVLVWGQEIVWVPGYRVAQGWEVAGAAGPSLHIRIDRS
jgi:tRNA(Ile)-lysidine synthase